MKNELKDNTLYITPKGRRGNVTFGAYFDLVFLLAKRNLSVKYKQTILGPLWLVLVPILSALVHAFLFGGIAKIDSGNAPYFLFYMVGNTLWLLFFQCFSQNSRVFLTNATLFKRVYFPRSAVVLSNLLCALFTFAVQFLITLIIAVVYYAHGLTVEISFVLLPVLLPVFIYVMALASGMGLIFSALTAKYRDLISVEGVFLEVFKYLSPVVYVAANLNSALPAFSFLNVVNPLAPALEIFRYTLLGPTSGDISPVAIMIGCAETLVLFFVGVLLFKRAERNFVDVV